MKTEEEKKILHEMMEEAMVRLDSKKLEGLVAIGLEKSEIIFAAVRRCNYKTATDFRNIDMALELGADVNAETNDGYTPLCCVLGSRNLKLMEHLLKAGADPNSRCGRYDSILHSAIAYYETTYRRRGNDKYEYFTEPSKLLIKYGADVNFRDRNGDTALHVAFDHNHKMIKHLVKAGADVNAKNNRGRTALEHEVIEGRIGNPFQNEEFKFFVEKMSDEHRESIESIFRRREEERRKEDEEYKKREKIRDKIREETKMVERETAEEIKARLLDELSKVMGTAP